MTKIIYALNHKASEDLISSKLGPDYLQVGVATYREAVLSVLPGSGADIIIMRDTLQGSIDIASLFEQVRNAYPEVRIIFICAQRPRGDRLLAQVVSLGIYDILNKDAVSIDEIVRHIQHPATFRDVSAYYSATQVLECVPEETPQKSGKSEKKRGFFSSLKGNASPAAQEETGGIVGAEPAESTPQINVDLLRQSIMEEATRNAQKNLDAMIEKAVEEETEKQRNEIAKLQKSVKEKQNSGAQKDARINDLLQQLEDERLARSKAESELSSFQDSAKKSIGVYEQQMQSMMSQKDTPAWYGEQQKKWKEREEQLQTELIESKAKVRVLEEDNKRKAAECEMMRKSHEEIVEKLQIAESTSAVDADADSVLAKTRRDLSEAKGELLLKNEEIENLKKDLDLALEVGPDFSEPVSRIPYFQDTDSYEPSEGPARTILILGSKHGVGTSTVALNLATAVAMTGKKTLLIEFNDSFPLLNEYFELTNVPLGIHDALASAASGNTATADAAIIRFRSLKTSNRALAKVYRKLPKGLHLLLHSNEDLLNSLNGRHREINPPAILSLVNYLVLRQQYAYLILDVQPDDANTIHALITSGVIINKLIMAISQDPHSISSAGALISQLAKSRASGLVVNAEYGVTKFNQIASMTIQKISKHLHIPQQQFFSFSEDTVGYVNAASAGFPYVMNGGRFAAEYEMMRDRIG